MASWREKLTSSQAKLSHILSSGDMSDVTFVVGEPPEQKRFKLHKFILSMSSDVFFTMFYGSLPEMGEVKVPDIQPDIFEIMMKYMYEESFSVDTVEQAMYTYFASEKYNISHLRDLCATYITDNLSPENISILYKMPVLLETLQLKSKCKIVLSGHSTSDLLTGENFAEAPFDMVKDIVQLESLNVSSEANLFDLVLKWVKSICLKLDPTYTIKGLRAVMDHFLPHIRFLGMSIETFHLGPASSGIFTDSEIASISQNLVAPGRRELPVWCHKGMSRSITRVFTLFENYNCCFRRKGSLTSIENFITIHTGNILFKGVTVYVEPVWNLPTASLQINIVDSTSLTMLERISAETNFSYYYKKSLLMCMLLKPFPLNLSKVYQICLSSNSYIFSPCQHGIPENSARSDQDFEMEYRVTRESNFYLLLGRYYAHFHEILYSKF